MIINQVPEVSRLRQPRAMVLINGTPIKFTQWDVSTNNFYEADTFRVTAPLSEQPFDMEYLFNQQAVMVEIKAGFPANPSQFNQNDLETLITGAIEPIKINKGNKTINFSGRDLTSLLIDTKTYQKYPNNTLSQIVETLAAKHGLKTIVTQTNTRVGAYYQSSYVDLTDSQTTEWDLLVNLAQHEQFTLYVKGNTIYCHPRPTPSNDSYSVDCQDINNITRANAVRVEIDYNYKYAGDVIVEVRSHSLKTGKPITVRVSATRNRKTVLTAKAKPVGNSQVFPYEEPNLTPEQALQFAYARLEEITRHEKILTFSDAANLLLQKDTILQLKNYSPSADQYYYIDSISRTFSIQSNNFSMSVRAKNHSPNTVKLI